MAMTINTNIVSINAQRNLGLSGNSLSTSMQRLSSGLRVNSAKDDAAGLAIAERMNTQIRGLTVAARNANDGISLAQTAEGALGKVGDMLQRMRELAVQASNATNSASDRAALQAEVDQMVGEIDRVAKQTTFNGQSLLNGGFAGGLFQVGANAGDNITVNAITNATAKGLAKIDYAENVANVTAAKITDFDTAIKAGELSLSVGGQKVELGAIAAAKSGEERLGQVVAAINNKTADTGVTAFLSKESSGVYSVRIMSDKLDESGDPAAVTFNGFTTATTGLNKQGAAADLSALADLATDFGALDTALTGYDEADPSTVAAAKTALSEAIASVSQPGLKAAFQVAADKFYASAQGDTEAGELQTDLEAAVTKAAAVVTAYNAAFGASGTVDNTTLTGLDTALTAAGVGADAFVLSDYHDGTAWKSADSQAKAEQAIKTLAAGYLGGTGDVAITASNAVEKKGIEGISVSSQADAWAAMKSIDSAIDQVNSARGQLGALQTRFEKAVENIDIQNENASAARGRIVDADFAAETANLSRTQILQQAGTAMVAQANQLPQQVLSLLQ